MQSPRFRPVRDGENKNDKSTNVTAKVGRNGIPKESMLIASSRRVKR